MHHIVKKINMDKPIYLKKSKLGKIMYLVLVNNREIASIHIPKIA